MDIFLNYFRFLKKKDAEVSNFGPNATPSFIFEFLLLPVYNFYYLKFYTVSIIVVKSLADSSALCKNIKFC